MKIPNSFYVRGELGVAASTAFTAGAAPKTLSGVGLDMQRVMPGTLSALTTVDAETDTITIEAKWQVSNDNSTYYDCANSVNNAATVVLATGTSGADAAVTKVIPAPDAVYAWPYARMQLVTGTGSASGTTDIGGFTYYYMKPGGTTF